MSIKISDDLYKADSYINTLAELDAENAKSQVGFDDKTQSFSAWLNREIWDHDEEMIKADGWDLSVHDLNPVMMWAHEYTQKPLGNSMWTRRKLKDDPAGLLWRPSFTTETQEGIDTYKLYKARVLRAFSAGFKVKETDKKSDKKGRSIFTNVILLEGSAVPIPANFLSLTLALENDFIKSKTIKDSFGDLLSRTDSRLLQTDMTDKEFEYIEKSFGAVKEKRKVVSTDYEDRLHELTDMMANIDRRLEQYIIKTTNTINASDFIDDNISDDDIDIDLEAIEVEVDALAEGGDISEVDLVEMLAESGDDAEEINLEDY